MKFYLGTSEPTWLSRSHVPLFVSFVRLYDRCKVKLPKARVPWALDSSGFSVLDKWGRYPWTAQEYADKVRTYRDQIGNLDWAAIQDWMCEDVILAKTGLSVAGHQLLTVNSYLELRRIAPDLPWLPVLQGFTHEEYLACVDLYAAAGVDLTRAPLVGIGSVCRRESTAEAEVIIRDLTSRGISLHGFGFKVAGLERCSDVLSSADSMAWSGGSRKKAQEAVLAGKKLELRSPQNSPRVALDWLSEIRTKAKITEARTDTRFVCPFCESTDVHPAFSDCLDYSCVECGETWEDIRQPSLLDPVHNR